MVSKPTKTNDTSIVVVCGAATRSLPLLLSLKKTISKFNDLPIDAKLAQGIVAVGYETPSGRFLSIYIFVSFGTSNHEMSHFKHIDGSSSSPRYIPTWHFSQGVPAFPGWHS